MAANTFKRYEIKYLLSKEQKAAVLEAMREHMQPDEFGNSTIRNIYFDSPNFELIRNSLEKPLYKEKLRVRSYKKVNEDEKIFIELKKKYDKIVYKRRIAVSEREAMAYLCGGGQLANPNQISREIDYFLSFYDDLDARVFISYDRSAYFDKDDSDLRMTFDENILWRTENVSLKEEAYGTPILKAGESLLEIKSAGGFPLWLARVLNENKIYKTSFSKYGKAYEAIVNEGRDMAA